jgi:hypothetical protein
VTIRETTTCHILFNFPQTAFEDIIGDSRPTTGLLARNNFWLACDPTGTINKR